jgi:hypothetical protein
MSIVEIDRSDKLINANFKNFEVITDKEIILRITFGVYSNRNNLQQFYKEINYIIDDELTICGKNDIMINNKTKFRQNIQKILGVEKMSYEDCKIMIYFSKGVLSGYRLDTERYLTDISMSFKTDSMTMAWIRKQKINSIINA